MPSTRATAKLGSRSAAELAALLAAVALAVAAPLVLANIQLGRLTISDAVTPGVPLLIFASMPFLFEIGPRRIPPLALEVPALVFLALALPSIFVAQYPLESVLTWLRYAAYIALAWTVAAVCVRPGNRRILLWAVVLAGVVSLGKAFAQVASPSAVDLEFAIDGAVRVFGWMRNPNFYAEYLVLVFASALGLVVTEKGALRVASGAALLAVGVGLALTYTRGTWIALAVGLAIFAMLVDLRLLWGLLAGAVLLMFVPGVAARLLSVFVVEGSSLNRFYLWRMAADMIRSNPIVGVGIGGYLDAFRQAAERDPGFVLGDLRQTAHNSLLLITAEVGVAGGVAFTWLLARAMRLGLIASPRLKADRDAFRLNAALAAGVVAFVLSSMVSNSFQHPQATVFFWMVLGVMMGNAAGAWDVPPSGRAWLSWLPRTRGVLLLDRFGSDRTRKEGATS